MASRNEPRVVNSVVESWHSLTTDHEVGCFEDWCLSENITSPIEMAFFTAIHLMLEQSGLGHHNTMVDGKLEMFGTIVSPQFKIDKYRADFLVSYRKDPEFVTKKVVVECDGHNFHDRSEPERRAEKQRDRFFQKNGYRVFHFTGSEIIKNPFFCASEVLEFLTGRNLLEEYAEN